MKKSLIFLAAWFTSASCVLATTTLIVENKVHQTPLVTTDSFFDVFFDVQDAPSAMAGYQIKLDLNPTGAGVQFLGVQNPGSPHSAVFPATPPTDLGSDGDTILATAFLNSGTELINDDEGLLRVLYRMSPGASGVFNVTIDLSQTLLADASAGAIAYQSVNGTITIPEPALAGMFALGSLLLRRRSKH